MKTKIPLFFICLIAFINHSFSQGRVISIVGGSVIAYDNNFATCDTLHTFYEIEKPPRGRLIQLPDGKFYGQTYASIFKMNADGSGYETIKRFLYSEGQELSGNFIYGSDGYFYGVAEHSGTNNYGTAFRIQPDGNNFEVLHQFDDFTGEKPTHIIELTDGSLVGITTYGGNDGNGFIFKMNKDGSSFIILKDFTDANGSSPNGIMQASDGNLYGVNYRDGANNHGTFFKLATDGTGFQVLKAFDGLTEGGGPNGTPVEADDGLLYFPVSYWGAPNGSGKGTLCKIAKDGTNFSVLKIFESNGVSGVGPIGRLSIDGTTIYGTTAVGGTNDNGVVYVIDTDGTNFSVLKSLDGQNEGDTPYGGIMEGSNGSLYGLCEFGGIEGYSGSIYKIDKNGSNFSILNDFASTDGLGPVSNLAELNGVIYGTTDEGGIHGGGTIFSINADGTNFSTLFSFNESTDGGSPRNLIITQNRIYGYCLTGGSNIYYGTLFKMNLDGSNFEVIQEFDHPSGVYYLKLGSDDIIYGYYGLGYYFTLDPSDDTFTTIGQGYLSSPLTEDSDGYFYSSSGSISGFSIHRMNKDGSDIQTILSVGDPANNGLGVWRLEEGLDGKLYGATSERGHNFLGTFFSVNRDGTNFNVIYQLGGGPIPFQRFQLLSDGNFYGYNSYINSSHFLKIPPDGSPVTSLKSYDVVEEGYGRDDYFIEIGGNTAGPQCAMYFGPENGVDSVGNKMGLAWEEVTQATGYKVYVGTDGGGTQTPTDFLNGTVVNAGGPPIFEVTNLQPNTTYYWQAVAFNNNGDATDCPIWSFQTAPSPANDLCGDAIELTPSTSCNYQLFSNLSSTNSGLAPSPQCKTMENDVWFKVRMPASGDLTIETGMDSTSFLGLFDVDMEVYSGDCSGGLTSIACGGDIDPNPPFPDFPDFHVQLDISNAALANQMVYIRVWGAYGYQGTFNLCAHDPSVTTNTCNPCDTFNFPSAPFMGDTTFVACDSIISQMDIMNTPMVTSDVTYQSGISITLKPGFYVQAGADFLAQIAPCNNVIADEPSLSRAGFNQENTVTLTTQIEVFPNPFSSSTTINFAVSEAMPIQLQLLDFTGKIVQTIVPLSHYEMGQYQINLQNDQLQTGIYFFHLSNPKEHVVKKVMIIR